MVIKHPMSCCALCQITCGNSDSIEDIKEMVDKTKAESKEVWHPKDRRSGERAILVITNPYEWPLAKKLRRIGFKPIAEFDRRNGYPADGMLTMWFLNF